MVPPIKTLTLQKKKTLHKRKTELSDIKEDDEAYNEELSTLYVKPEESIKIKGKTVKAAAVKKHSKPKLETTKQLRKSKDNSEKKKDRNLVNEKSKAPKKSLHKLSATKNKQKTSDKPEIRLRSPKKESQGSSNRPTYIPVIRSFADPDLTSLPVDDIFTKRQFLPRNNSKLPKPIKAGATKKVKKIKKDKDKLDAEKNVVNKKISKNDATKSKSLKQNTDKTKKLKGRKNNSNLPKLINNKKHNSNSKQPLVNTPINTSGKMEHVNSIQISTKKLQKSSIEKPKSTKLSNNTKSSTLKGETTGLKVSMKNK